MATGINSVKTEYQEEVDKRINTITETKGLLQKEVGKLTENVLSEQ